VPEHRRLSGKSDLLRRVLRTVQRHGRDPEGRPKSVRARNRARQPNDRSGDRRQSVSRRVRERGAHRRIRGVPGPLRFVHVLQQE